MLILPKLICPKDYLTILQIEQSTNWTDSNSPNFNYTICSLNIFELTSKHIEQCELNMILFNWPLYNFKEYDYHNWSKPQLIQAIGVRVVINFYTREERSDRARWRLGPLAVGSWDLSQASSHTQYLFNYYVFNKLFDEFKFVHKGLCSIKKLFNWLLFNWSFVK